MAIRFPGLHMAEKKKERSRSRSHSPVGLLGNADSLTKVKGGRAKPRAKTPSPDRPLRVVKEVGIGRRKHASEFAATSNGPQAKAKPKAKAKARVAIASDGEDSNSG